MNLKSNNYSMDLKLRIIKTYNEKIYNVIEIAKIYNISKSSIYSWIKLYKNSQLLPKQEYIKPTSKFQNIKIRNIILTYISENPNFIYTYLIIHIYKITKISIKKSLLYNIIHDLNLTKKVSKFKKIYGKYNNTKKELLQKQMTDISYDKIISIDEVSFDTNIIHNYAWSLKNVPVIKTIGATYKRLTMICAISNKKILHYKILPNSADSHAFLDFLKGIPNIKNKYLFLDNAVIHHSKIVTEFVTNNKINLLFNVPYSPEFNPIEIMFSKLKKLVKDCINNNNLNHLTINIIGSRIFKYVYHRYFYFIITKIK